MMQRWIFTTVNIKDNRFLILNYLIKILLNFWVLFFLFCKALLDIITGISFYNHCIYSTSISWATILDQAMCYVLSSGNELGRISAFTEQTVRSGANKKCDIGKLLKWIVKNYLFFQLRHHSHYKGFPWPECSGSWTGLHQSGQLSNG